MEETALIPEIFAVWLGDNPISTEAKNGLASHAHWVTRRKGEGDREDEGEMKEEHAPARRQVREGGRGTF
jgi:hypothetical protein